jgi:hypothetical protein
MRDYRITIDPGTEYCGVAVWEADAKLWAAVRPPVAVALLRPSTVAGTPYEDRATNIASKFSLDVLSRFHYLDAPRECRQTIEIASEFPEIFGADGGSMAAGVKGTWMKLAFMVGCIAMAGAVRGIPFRPVPVRQWKGQMPKDMVERRIRRVLGDTACAPFKRDIWDAVGIGLFLKGHL